MDTKVWRAVLGEIELTLSPGNYMTWFKNSRLLKINHKEAVIGVSNIFVKQTLEKKYVKLINDTLRKNGYNNLDIKFKIHTTSDKPAEENNNVQTLYHNSKTRPTNKQTASSRSELTHSYRRGLNEKYTFETFIVGSGNELAHAACQAIAQNPGTKYNPLFVYGGVGIGKTHLIQAVGNEVLKNNSNARIVYISTEQFVQEFLDAIRYKKNTSFAGHYRSADVLIVDDIQFIAGKEKTQEEFFHTFNALHQANKQIIISSDKPPNSIPTLEDRLRSRFAWGMSIDMQTPDFETRCAIIQTKAGQNNTTLPQPVVEFLANHIQSNIRELEGALNQVMAFCEMRNLKPTVEVCQSLLGSPKNRTRHVNARHIVEKTARHFNITTDDIIGSKRDKYIVVPRQVAMYLLRNELKLSFPNIARELGRKDHTTAMHSYKKIEKDSVLDPFIRDSITEIKSRLYG
jgi:chromosomal replication initiator protein